MATPFATASDLAARLKRSVWTDPAELEQVNLFLEDASEDLRAEIGWQVYPPVTVTVSAYPDSQGVIRLPGIPGLVTAVVDAAGATLPAASYELLDGSLRVLATGRMSVTYLTGYAIPPAELVKWTCVLAAQSLAAFEEDGSIGGATPASRSLADYRISHSERQQMGDLPIPDRVLERLRSTYGSSAFVTS